MFPSPVLRQYVCRLTLFTRQHCGLCQEAKAVLHSVWTRRPYEYDEIDIMSAGREEWKNLYEFDVPVLHVDKTKENHHDFRTTSEARKLMHRFHEKEVEVLLDETIKSPSSPAAANGERE